MGRPKSHQRPSGMLEAVPKAMPHGQVLATYIALLWDVLGQRPALLTTPATTHSLDLLEVGPLKLIP